MNKTFRISIGVLTLATVALAIAMAYVFGLMGGIRSQQQFIKEILEDLPHQIIADFELYTHPLWYPLLGIALITAAFWIAIAITYLSEKKREQRLQQIQQ